MNILLYVLLLIYLLPITCFAQKPKPLTPYERYRLRVEKYSKPYSPPKKTGPFTLTDAIDRIRYGVVRVEIRYDVKGPDSKIMPFIGLNGKQTKRVEHGSGFFLNDSGYVATNFHVVASLLDTNAINREIIVAIGVSMKNRAGFFTQNFNEFGAQIVAGDQEKDLAILLPVRNPFKSSPLFRVDYVEYGVPILPKFSTRIIEDGARVAASGYPLDAATLITSSGYIASSYPANGRYEVDMRLNPGNSGGPVYLVETGEIIGVAVSVGMLPAQLRLADGRIVGSDITDSLYIDYRRRDTTIKAHLVELGYFYNSGLSQVINLNEVIGLAQRAKIPLKLGQTLAPQQSVGFKPKTKKVEHKR